MAKTLNKQPSLVGDLLRQRAVETPSAPFVCVADRWYSYREIDERSSSLAAALAQRGLRAGDRLALISMNRIEVVDVIFACAKLGVIEVPLNAWLRGDSLRYQLADADPAMVIADAPGIEALQDKLPTGCLMIAIDKSADFGIEPYSALLAADGRLPQSQLDPSAPLCIMYTSGTTGMPKGCLLSHGYFTTAPQPYVELWKLTSNDRIMSAIQLFHAGGQLITLMNALASGGAAILEASFSASQFMQRAADVGATVLVGVGPMAKAILAQPMLPADRANSVRIANFSPLDSEARLTFESRFATTVVIEGYGQTECLPICLGSPELRRSDTSARATSYLDVDIVGGRGQSVAPGGVGEIVVRARTPYAMFSGYWRRAEPTTEWHHTGDNGVSDDEGFIKFVDRRADSLRRRGENVSSAEVELAIASIPGIERVAVTGVSSPLGEDDIRATIVCDGEPPTPRVLFEELVRRIPYFAVPRYVVFCNTLPTTITGRVQKHLLRDEPLPDNAIDFESLGFSVPVNERRGG